MRVRLVLVLMILMVSKTTACGRAEYCDNFPKDQHKCKKEEPKGTQPTTSTPSAVVPKAPVTVAGQPGKDGSSCSAYKVGTTTTIQCTNGTSSTIVDGQSGNPGQFGQDGTNGKDGVNGTNGKDGVNGTNGKDGKDGLACTVSRVSNGSVITCPDGSNSLILDGKDGSSAYSFTDVIDPCGKQSSFDEVLFKTTNGSIVAHYASGSEQFLTILSVGNYITTDGTSCYFTVHPDGSVTW